RTNGACLLVVTSSFMRQASHFTLLYTTCPFINMCRRLSLKLPYLRCRGYLSGSAGVDFQPIFEILRNMILINETVCLLVTTGLKGTFKTINLPGQDIS